MTLSSESNIVIPYTNTPNPSSAKDRRWKGRSTTSEVAPNCPRCDSSNTKFCYYNNYSLTQPRYFCKGCRRYWTKGGSLRNVPVGGGCRKNRRAGAATTKNVLHSRPSNSDFSRQFRPDLVLDDPVGNESADTSRSDIDLAVLYSKFTNHSTSGEPNDDQTRSSQFHQQFQFDTRPGVQLQQHQIRVDSVMPSFNTTVSTNNVNKYVPFQTDFNLATSCSSELLLDESITNDLFWSNYPILPQPIPNPSGYGPIQEDPSMVLNQSSSTVLNTNFGMLDFSCFETFSR